MYYFKSNIEVKVNKTKASEVIGIARPHITNIINRKIGCSKHVAYCITKYINSEAEISDYFERIE